jgi:hypothetical protein
MGPKAPTDLRQMAMIASRGLFAPQSLSPDEIRAMCATALRHVPDHRQVAMVAAQPRYEQIGMALAVARYCDLAE